MEHHHESFFANPRTWIGLAFFIFYAIFGRKIWAMITGLLDKRAAMIRAELEEASRLRTEAEAMLRDAQSQRELAAKEATAMLDNARTEAANVAEAARKEAADAAKRRERMAMDRIGAAEKAAVSEVRQAAADIASRDTGSTRCPGEPPRRLVPATIIRRGRPWSRPSCLHPGRHHLVYARVYL